MTDCEAGADEHERNYAEHRPVTERLAEEDWRSRIQKTQRAETTRYGKAAMLRYRTTAMYSIIEI